MGKIDTKYKYFAKNTALFTISNFGSKFLTFFLTLLYTRVFTTSEYGMADIISTTATLCILTLTLTIANSVMRFSIENVDKSDLVLRYGLRVLMRGSCALVIIAIIVRAFNIISWNDYAYIFLVLIFTTHALEEMLNYYLRALDKVNIMVFTSLASSAVKLITSFLLLLVFKLGLIGYLISLVTGPVCAIAIALFNIYPLKHTDATKEELKKLHSEMIRYSIPASINSLGWWITGSIDRYFLIAIEGTSINGIYSVAYKIPAIMGTLANIFGQTWGLSAIREYNSETKKDDSGFFTKMYNLYAAVVFVVCSLLILLNIPIARVVFAKEFFDAWRYSPLLVVGTGCNCLAIFFGGVFSAAKHNSEMAYSMLASMLTNIVLNAILIPSFSAAGAAIATLVSYYVVLATRYLFSRKYLEFRIHLVRDHIAITLLITQIVMNLRSDHFYIGQLAVFIIILAVYRTEWVGTSKKALTFAKGNFRRKRIYGDE